MLVCLRVVAISLVVTLLAGCPSTDQTLVLIGGQRVDAGAVDRDPLSVLPSGALFIGTLDAEALFRSQLGAQVNTIVSTLLPLGPESIMCWTQSAGDWANIVLAALSLFWVTDSFLVLADKRVF